MASGDDNLAIHRTQMEEKYLSAYKKDDCATIDEMLKMKEIDPDHKINNSSLLSSAIEDVRPTIVKTLIDNGANIVDNQIDESLYLTLCRIIFSRPRLYRNHDEKTLMSVFDILMGALEKISMETVITKVFAARIDRTTLFLKTCKDGQDKFIVRFMNLITDETLHFFTDMTWFINYNDENPFHNASNMDPDTVSLLIDRLPFRELLINRAQPQEHIYGQLSPLHDLALQHPSFNLRYNNLAQIAKLLIGGSADPDKLNEFGSAPVHYAAGTCNEPVLETLLRVGCRLDVRNHNGDTPLLLALHRRRGLNANNLPLASRILELLLAFGVDLQKEQYLYTEEENPKMFSDTNMGNRPDSSQVPPDWLETFRQLRRSNVMNSLQRTCRNVIRRHLKPKADEVINTLTCIPNTLKSYLLVENEPDVLTMVDGILTMKS